MNRCRAVSIVLALLVLFTAATPAAGLEWLTNSARFNFRTSPVVPVDQFPGFSMFMVVPVNLVPAEQPSTEVVCNVNVQRNDRPVKNAKGVWRGGVMVRDNATGVVESTIVANGRFKTAEGGEKVFRFQIPVEVFADGFESGDVSAWSYVEGEFTNRKKATFFYAACSNTVRRD